MSENTTMITTTITTTTTTSTNAHQQTSTFVTTTTVTHPPQQLQCPRCHSEDTKFCYYNNYNTSQPRHFCRSCRRHWTHGGVLRDIPVGGGSRKNTKRKNPMNPTITSAYVTTFDQPEYQDYQSVMPPPQSLLPPTQGLPPPLHVDDAGDDNGFVSSLLEDVCFEEGVWPFCGN